MLLPDAAAVAKILGGRREGAGYLCRCPVKTHGKGRGDLRPSLSVSDGRTALVFHCFAGCRPRDIIAALTGVAGAAPLPPYPAAPRPSPPSSTATRTTTALAQKLWRQAKPVAGTLAESYLRSRRLPLPPPATIRYLPSFRYDATTRLPCLIAAVQAPSREIIAVQLTFLDPNTGAKAHVEHPRRAIGPLGDGLLRLAPAAEHLGLAEGFESAWGASLLHDGAPVWASLGADRFCIVRLPAIVKRVTIYADYDAPGLAAALAFFQHHPELEIWIARPAKVGADFGLLWETHALIAA